MGILESAKPVMIVCTRDRDRAVAFYRDTLGLAMTSEDRFAAIFDVAGIPLRVSTVPDFTAHEHTVLGFHVPDVVVAVKALGEKGVTFNRYAQFAQDELGILTVAGTGTRVAWFEDPDGNVLSVTNA
ncbi:MAG TPA: VOC family protein [Bryobacteraceae bacterium]|nr:VOC family protein [Bryobacteraceae bacterium]